MTSALINFTANTILWEGLLTAQMQPLLRAVQTHELQGRKEVRRKYTTLVKRHYIKFVFR